ncbi:DUF896 domain-containing protein [Oceanobacillus neutriphilus]|uniref:UPF0291 protein GCM10011346_46360 n=1 Tax=Oceanobacillus neutriphilus TaxID=531815 RepID=A0ABQ2P1T3_9BACI|nr:DUF896 domain-containing protein [Oceanobacillus neutriphilus]GGP16008.1 UPF0291 protein [Oceanobacillus neutriphilus]
MLSKNKLDRINILANKAKNEGLTEEEKNEQQLLRKEYLANVRGSFKNHLKGMTVVDPEGNDVTPQKLRDYQERSKKH